MRPQVLAIPARWVGPVLGLSVLACQGSNLTLPPDNSPTRLDALSGSGQQGTIGAELAKPLVAKVTDATGRPVPNVTLRFHTEVPAAQVDQAVISTDSSGTAEVRVRLGTTEGLQIFDALLDETATSGLKATFAVIAVAPPSEDDDDEDGGNGGGDDDEGENGGGGGNGGGGNGGGGNGGGGNDGGGNGGGGDDDGENRDGDRGGRDEGEADKDEDKDKNKGEGKDKDKDKDEDKDEDDREGRGGGDRGDDD
jgi:uncharacterized membrane protein YgcG